MSLTAIFGFGSSIVGMKVTGSSSPVVGARGVVFGCRVIMGDIDLGLMVEIYCQVVRIEI